MLVRMYQIKILTNTLSSLSFETDSTFQITSYFNKVPHKYLKYHCADPIVDIGLPSLYNSSE